MTLGGICKLWSCPLWLTFQKSDLSTSSQGIQGHLVWEGFSPYPLYPKLVPLCPPNLCGHFGLSTIISVQNALFLCHSFGEKLPHSLGSHLNASLTRQLYDPLNLNHFKTFLVPLLFHLFYVKDIKMHIKHNILPVKF